MAEIRGSNILFGKISGHGYVQIVLIFILVLMTVVIAGGIYFFRKETLRSDYLITKVQTLEKDVDTLVRKTTEKKRVINLTVPTIQKIDDIFMTAKLSAEPYSTGLKVTGLIINSTALGHEDAKFRVTVSNQSKEFTINSIPPGSSKKFEIFIPDVALEKATSAQLQCIESSMSYYRD
ncbi:MAG: hypothetical protein HY754_05735 [Nitrospirae bacterium]|nr:hypothetical protein [Nitrospirota bacterium]